MKNKPYSIFETTVADQELDPAYVYVRDNSDLDEERRFLDRLWDKFRSHADNNFHDQVQRRGQFQSRLWEMRLTCTFLEKGFSVSSEDHGPDISIYHSQKIHIEAIAPSTTVALENNYKRARRHATPVPEDDVILRYTAAFKEKWEKYITYLKDNTVGSDDIYIIAISGANIHFPDSSDDVPWILKPLYGLGGPLVRIEVTTGRQEHDYSHLQIRLNANRSPVESDLFLNDSKSVVSAVIFSPSHFLNWPAFRGYPNCNDFLLAHNLFADNNLEEQFVKCGQEWAVRGDYLERIFDYRKKQEL